MDPNQVQTAPPPYKSGPYPPQQQPQYAQPGQPQYAQPAQPQYAQPQPQYAQPQIVQPAVAAQSSVVVVQQGGGTGNCPVCRNGFLVEDYTCCGICLAIVFFPIGLLCCLAMREKRCTNCNVTY